MADIGDLVPVSRAEFAAELTPCLALTSGVGMGGEEQTTWLRAAYKALDGIPIGLLKRGAAAAMKKADHPSKIVPAIMAEVEQAWDWRRRHRAAKAEAAAALPAPAPASAPVPHEETQAILNRVWKTMAEHDSGRDPARPTRIEGGSDRPARVPTREDYIAMGVDPAVLDAQASEAA
jgi:hypothetical protein